MRVCTRRLEFDAAHRVMEHESKCRNLHGHRYVVDVTCAARELDGLGRVIDFGVIKQVLGGYIDERIDHGTIANCNDLELIDLCRRNDWRLWVIGFNPTAENIAAVLYATACNVLADYPIEVVRLRVYETPNCWAEVP
jgi:6-pyruvoyltetrahydropterin/6-carboxytetrahydropterin synthase